MRVYLPINSTFRSMQSLCTGVSWICTKPQWSLQLNPKLEGLSRRGPCSWRSWPGLPSGFTRLALGTPLFGKSLWLWVSSLLLPVMQNFQTKASDVNKSKNVPLDLIFGGFCHTYSCYNFLNIISKTVAIITNRKELQHCIGNITPVILEMYSPESTSISTCKLFIYSVLREQWKKCMTEQLQDETVHHTH